MNKYKIGLFLLMIAFIALALIASRLNQQLEQAKRGDLNLDGQIEITDLSIMADNWGK